jgi:glucose/arabinose dehydrogenase
MKSGPLALLQGLVLALGLPAGAQPELDLLNETPLTEPTAVAHGGGPRLYVAERAGLVQILEEDGTVTGPFLDLSGRVTTEGQGGLLSIALHPLFALNGFIYAFFTEPGDIVVTRFTRDRGDPDLVDPGSEREILRLARDGATNLGGQLQFGPDGFLYIGIGDGGAADDPTCRAQDPQQLFGKVLRIDVNVPSPSTTSTTTTSTTLFTSTTTTTTLTPPTTTTTVSTTTTTTTTTTAPATTTTTTTSTTTTTLPLPPFVVPESNPFVGEADPDDLVADEIWALGVRNPFRFTFDPTAGDLWLGDVGEATREEIDFQSSESRGGENYGWKVLEGTVCRLPGSPVEGGCADTTPPCDDPGYTAPAFEYEREAGDTVAVTGGVVYRGIESPAFQGRYVFADSELGAVWALSSDGPPFTPEFLIDVPLEQPVAIAEDVFGELIVVDFAGSVYRLSLGSDTLSPNIDCIVDANKATARVNRSAERAWGRCIQDRTKGKLSTSVEECAASDPKGKVAKSLEKLDDVAAEECNEDEPFGFVSAEVSGDAAVESASHLVFQLFGRDVDAAIPDTKAERPLARCQLGVWKAVERCQKAQRKEFIRCKDDNLENGNIDSPGNLAVCLGLDARGKAELSCGARSSKIRKEIDKRCVDAGVSLEQAFPGCDVGEATALQACVDAAARCHYCRMYDAADDLGVNCDLFDDSLGNASCRPFEVLSVAPPAEE